MTSTKTNPTPCKTTSKKQPALTEFIVDHLESGKAIDVKVISLKGKTSMAETLIIASGTSGRHVSSLAHHLKEALKKQGCSPTVDGSWNDGHWIALDAGNILIHLFHPETRMVYDLESLWI